MLVPIKAQLNNALSVAGNISPLIRFYTNLGHFQLAQRYLSREKDWKIFHQMSSTFNFTKMALLNNFDMAEGEEYNRFPFWTIQSYKASFDVRIRVISQINTGRAERSNASPTS